MSRPAFGRSFGRVGGGFRQRTLVVATTHRHLHLFIENVPPAHVPLDWHVTEVDVGSLSVIAATAAVADAADDIDDGPATTETSFRPVQP